MFAVNVTTLLVPLFVMHALARKIIPQDKAYIDLKYSDVLKLSAIYQGGIVAWVAFWAFYGQGATIASDVFTFGSAYMLVILIEPIADLGVLYLAKSSKAMKNSSLFVNRLYKAA